MEQCNLNMLNDGNNKRIITSKSLDQSMRNAKNKIITQKSRPTAPLDLLDYQQKVDLLLYKEQVKPKKNVQYTKTLTNTRYKEVIIIDLNYLEEKIYFLFVDNGIFSYDEKHKRETRHIRKWFVVELITRLVESEALWSDFYNSAGTLGAMDDLYAYLLKNILRDINANIEDYYDFLIAVEEMVYFRIPSKLKHPTWNVWTTQTLGNLSMLLMNEGDYRISYFNEKALTDKKHPFYKKRTKEDLDIDV